MQIWRFARYRILTFLTRFHEEGFLTGKIGLRLLQDGTKAPQHLALSLDRDQREPRTQEYIAEIGHRFDGNGLRGNQGRIYKAGKM